MHLRLISKYLELLESCVLPTKIGEENEKKISQVA
jgi:hypothetical protein